MCLGRLVLCFEQRGLVMCNLPFLDLLASFGSSGESEEEAVSCAAGLNNWLRVRARSVVQPFEYVSMYRCKYIIRILLLESKKLPLLYCHLSRRLNSRITCDLAIGRTLAFPGSAGMKQNSGTKGFFS